MEIELGISFFDLLQTEDHLLSSYHPEVSNFVDSLFKTEPDSENYPEQNHQMNYRKRTYKTDKRKTCSRCFRKVVNLENHDCYLIQELKLSDEQKESLNDFQLYGCLGNSNNNSKCLYRSNYKGKSVNLKIFRRYQNPTSRSFLSLYQKRHFDVEFACFSTESIKFW